MTGSQIQIATRKIHASPTDTVHFPRNNRRDSLPFVAILEPSEEIRTVLSEMVREELGLRTLEGPSPSKILISSDLTTMNKMRSPKLQAVIADVGFGDDLREMHALNTLLRAEVIPSTTSLLLSSTDPRHLEKISSFRLDTEGLYTFEKPFDLIMILQLLRNATEGTVARREGRLFLRSPKEAPRGETLEGSISQQQRI